MKQLIILIVISALAVFLYFNPIAYNDNLILPFLGIYTLISLIVSKYTSKLRIPNILTYFILAFLIVKYFGQSFINEANNPFLLFLENITVSILILYYSIELKLDKQLKLIVQKMKETIGVQVFLAIVFTILFYFIINTDSNLFGLKEYNFLIIFLLIITPTPFLLFRSSRHSKFEQNLHKGLLARDSINIIISLILIFSVLSIFDRLNSQIFHDFSAAILIGILFYSYLSFIAKYFQKAIIFYLILPIFLFTQIAVWNSQLYLIVSMVTTGLLIRRNLHLYKIIFESLTDIIKSVYVLFVFAISLKYDVSMIHYIYPIIIIFTLRLITVFIGSKVFRSAESKDNYSLFVYVNSFQGILALYIIGYFVDLNIITNSSPYYAFVYFSALFALTQHYIGSLSHQDEIDESDIYLSFESEIKHETDFEKIDESGLLNSIVDKFNKTVQYLSTNFIDHYADNHINNQKKHFKKLINEYHIVFDKLEKEFDFISHKGSQLIKDKIRDNRNILANKFQKGYHEIYQTILDFNVSDLQYNYLKSIELEIMDFSNIDVNLTRYDLFRQKDDNVLQVLFKFLRRIYIRFYKVFNSSYEMKKSLSLKNIYLYFFFDKYASIRKYFSNHLYYLDFFTFKSYLKFYKSMDNQFLDIMDQIDKLDSEDNLKEKLSFFLIEAKKDIEFEYEEITNNFTNYVRSNKEILSRAYISLSEKSLEQSKKAGKVQFSQSFANESKVYRKYNLSKKIEEDISDHWKKLFKSYHGNIRIENEISSIQSQIRKLLNAFSEKISGELEQNVKDILSKLKSNHQELQSNFLAIEEANSEDIKHLKKRILYQIKIVSIKSIEDLRESVKFSDLINELLGHLHQLINRLPKHIYVTKSEHFNIKENEIIPKIDLYYAPIKQISKTYLEIEVTADLNEVNSQINISLNNLIQLIREITDFTSQKFEAIEDQEKKISPIELKNAVKEVLEQIDEKYDECIAFNDSMIHNISKKLVKDIVENTKQVKKLLTSQLDKQLIDPDESLIKSAKLSKQIKQQFIKYIQDSRPIVKRFFEKSALKIITEIKQLIFQDNIKLNEDIEVVEYLDRINTNTKNLPFIYRKLLTTDAVEIKEFLIGRNEQINLVRNAVDRWSKGQNSNISIYGLMGNGKTSFINCLMKYEINQQHVIRAKLSHTIIDTEEFVSFLSKTLGYTDDFKSIDSLEHEILKSDKRIIVILESVQRLFIKTVDGYDLIKRFHLFISNTSKHIMWINTFSEFSWDYLKYAIQISDHYSYQIQLGPILKDGITEIISSRNKMSGYEIKFDINLNEIPLLKRKFLQKEDMLTELEKYYYAYLTKLSKGNIYIALYLWNGSIQVLNNNILNIKKVENPPFDFIKSFDDMKIFTLLVILQQGGISIDIHEKIFSISKNESASVLNYLSKVYLIKKTSFDEKDFYTINKIAINAIIDVLKERNLIV